MTKEFVINYPDFGALSNAFESYRNSVSTVPLLAEDALDRVFADAGYKARMLRRIRLQWAVGITGLMVVTAALILELSNTTEAPKPSKPNVPVKVDTLSPANKKDTTTADTALQVSDFRLSKYAYDSYANLDSAVRHDPALGFAWRQADWNDLKEFCTDSGRVDTLIETLKLPLLHDAGVPGGESIAGKNSDSLQNFYILRRGKKYLLTDTSDWHYFISRWDHHRPKWWMRYAQLDRDHLVLGGWTDVHLRILAVRRKAIQKQTINF